MGGVINTVTKSGTNELHGNVYEIEQNDAFNARNTFLLSVAPFKWNTFGGAAGGPLRFPRIYNGKNRTFFLRRLSVQLEPVARFKLLPRANRRQPARRPQRLAKADLQPLIHAPQPGPGRDFRARRLFRKPNPGQSAKPRNGVLRENRAAQARGHRHCRPQCH